MSPEDAFDREICKVFGRKVFKFLYLQTRVDLEVSRHVIFSILLFRLCVYNQYLSFSLVEDY